METKITKEKKNALFSRNEVEVLVRRDITPSQAEARKIICEKFSCDEKLIRIKNILSRFGSKEFLISAFIYDSKESFDKIVKRTKQEIEAEKKAIEEQRKAEAERKKAEAEAKLAAESTEEVQSE